MDLSLQSRNQRSRSVLGTYLHFSFMLSRWVKSGKLFGTQRRSSISYTTRRLRTKPNMKIVKNAAKAYFTSQTHLLISRWLQQKKSMKLVLVWFGIVIFPSKLKKNICVCCWVQLLHNRCFSVIQSFIKKMYYTILYSKYRHYIYEKYIGCYYFFSSLYQIKYVKNFLLCNDIQTQLIDEY